MRLFRGLVKNSVDLDNKSCHDDHWSEREPKKPKAVSVIFERHDEKTGYQCNDPDDHPLVILFAEREFIHSCRYRSIKFFERHSQVFVDGKVSAEHRHQYADHQKYPHQHQKLLLVVQDPQVCYFLLRIV